MWFAPPIYLLIIGIEVLLSNYRKMPVYSWKETLINFYLSILNALLDLAIRGGYLLLLMFFFEQRVISLPHNIFYWCGLVVFMDLMFYWLHRLEHFCRLFWAVHVTHHSCENLNVSVAFRASVFQPLYRFIFFIPLVLCGFRPIDILFVYSLTQFWSIFVHTELIGKLGWLEYVFVTPSHHRVHHASNDRYLDKNMGMFLIIWDRMFGTFQEELPASEYEPIRYGLTQPLENQTPLSIIFHEWRDIIRDMRRKDLSFYQKCQYLLRPPGTFSRQNPSDAKGTFAVPLPDVTPQLAKESGGAAKAVQANAAEER